MPRSSAYADIIERIFLERYVEGITEISFTREDITRVGTELNIKLPKNLGDVLYSFRYRRMLPETVRNRAPEGMDWIIRSAGIGRYQFVARPPMKIVPNELRPEIKIPDSTPGIIAMYALNDEQGLLAKLRYNRLIDIFTGITCYSLQSHLRTTVPEIGQVETDEVYVGMDQEGIHYVFPVQAKGGRDKQGVVQIEQDFALCADKFSSLVCRAIAAQFMDNDLIALFSFADSESGVVLLDEKHYRLVPQDEITTADLEAYRARLPKGTS